MEVSEVGSRVLLCSPSLHYHYLNVLLHSVAISRQYMAPGQLVHPKERRKACHLLYTAAASTPQNTNNKTKLSCWQSPPRTHQGVQEKRWKYKTLLSANQSQEQKWEETGSCDSQESMGEINVCTICVQLC